MHVPLTVEENIWRMLREVRWEDKGIPMRGRTSQEIGFATMAENFTFYDKKRGFFASPAPGFYGFWCWQGRVVIEVEADMLIASLVPWKRLWEWPLRWWYYVTGKFRLGPPRV